jgi:hypothetical protein
MTLRRCLMTFALLGALVIARRADAVGDESRARAEDLEVVIDSRWCGTGSGGYYPIRFRVVNRGKDRELTFRYASRGAPDVRRTVAVPQNATTRFTLSIPCVGPGTYGQLTVLDRGRAIPDLGKSISLPDVHRDGTPRPALLVVSPATVDCALFEEAVNASWGASSGPYAYGGSTSDHEIIRPGMLPESWIDYSGVDLVAVPLATLDGLSAAERSAIVKWVHAGGTLIVYDVKEPPPASKKLADLLDLERHAAVTEWSMADPRTRRVVSAVTVSTVAGAETTGSAVRRDFDWPDKAFAMRRVMHGAVCGFSGNPFPGTPNDWDWFLRTLSQDRASWTGRHGLSSRLPNLEFLAFLVPSVKGVPVAAFLVLITLFTIVIGPLNYLWLWRQRRLYLLVITIPLVAFATSLALFGYSAVAHGFGTRSRVRSLTLLDQKANSAVTMSRLSLYSGLAPSGGLTFSPETAVYPIWPPDMSFDSGVLDWTDKQRLESGWLRSRTRTQFYTVAHRDQRGRVDVTPGAGGVKIANGLEWDLEALVVADESGTMCYGSDIPAGASADLSRITPQQRQSVVELLDRNGLRTPENASLSTGGPFRSGAMYYPHYTNVTTSFGSSLLEETVKELRQSVGPTGKLPPNTYFAVLRENPDVETGLEKTHQEAGWHVIVGRW